QFAIVTAPNLASRKAAPAATAPILAAFPIPNGPDLPNQQALFAAGYSNPIVTDATSFRVDHVFSAKLNAFARYNYAPSSSAAGGGGNTSLSTVLSRPTEAHTLTAGATYVIGPRWVDELRINASRNGFSQGYRLDNFGGAAALPAEYYTGLSATNSVIMM